MADLADLDISKPFPTDTGGPTTQSLGASVEIQQVYESNRMIKYHD